MSLNESLLRNTLERAGAAVDPSPDLLEGIKVAIARAERRRRLIALVVVTTVLLATAVVLAILLVIRS